MTSNERQPLIKATRVDHIEYAELPSKRAVTPLNKRQITLLTLARMAEPITFSIILPFVNDMVVDTGQIPVEDVGFYVGGIESSFSMTQIFVLYFWGVASDKYGRKPVLLLSLLGAFLASSIFGFAESLWVMYAARCLAGLFGGNSVVIRLLFSENSDPSNRARAFAFLAFGSNFGQLVGPIIGGFLAKPAVTFPNTLGKIWLFQRYPYSLPCLVAGGYVALVMTLCLIWLEEPPHKESTDESKSLRDILDKTTLIILLNWTLTATSTFCLMLILPLYLFTPIPLGGLSLNPSQIATFLAIVSLAGASWLLGLFPPLDRIIGTRRLYRLVTFITPFFSILPPIANTFARQGHAIAPWIVMGIWAVLGTGSNITFISSQLIINDFSPKGALGAVNGIAMTLAALTKGSTPAILNAIFALGVSRQIMQGYLAWFVIIVFGFFAYWASGLIPEKTLREVEEET